MDKNNTLYQCCLCGYTLPENNFNKSSSSIFAGIGHLPICKNCLEREYKKYLVEYNEPHKALQRICMLFDIYYDRKLFDSCKDVEEKVISTYLRRINLGQYRNRNFDTSINEGFFFYDMPDNLYDDSRGQKISTKLIEKWGDGLGKIDYNELEKHYKLLKSSNPNCDNNQEIFIVELCYTKMQQMKAVREGRVDDFKKLSDSYRQSFIQAGLKTVRDSGATESFTVGVNVETIEKYTPAEYYKDTELFKDHDKIGQYIERFLLRPLRNLQHGTVERDSNYYVKDEGEMDESSTEE